VRVGADNLRSITHSNPRGMAPGLTHPAHISGVNSAPSVYTQSQNEDCGT